MEPEKTYSLKKSLLVSFAVAFALICATYFLSLTLSRFQSILLPDSGASWYYWKLPHPELWATREHVGALPRAPDCRLVR